MVEVDRKKLMINYLPPSYTMKDVNLLFSRIGMIKACKLIHNHDTGLSMGYAFLEYQTEELAARAIELMNGLEIDGKTLKVNYARATNSAESKNRNLYVANLSMSLKENELRALFSKFGEIESVRLLTFPNGASRGSGMIRFSRHSEALAAIEELNGQVAAESNGPLTVKVALPPRQAGQNNVDMDISSTTITTKNNVHSGFGASTKSPNIRYNPLGNQTNSLIPDYNAPYSLQNYDNGFSRQNYNPFNLPSYDNQLAINRDRGNYDCMSIQSYDNNIINNYDNNSIGNFDPSLPSSTSNVHPMAQSTNKGQVAVLYVYGLQPSHTDLTLYELFSPFGGIIKVKAVLDLTKDDRPCKGFGFVNFINVEDAHRAIISMNNLPYDGKTLSVSFKSTKS